MQTWKDKERFKYEFLYNYKCGKMSEFVRIKITRKQAKELIEQFEKNANFHNLSRPESQYFSFIEKKGGVDIKLYRFEKSYFLEIFSTS